MLRQNLGRTPIFIAISTICALLLSSSFGTQSNQGAWAGTFPGPNGQIAFTSNRDGNYEIYVMNADGTGQTNLTDNSADDFSPSWSADGTKIAFTSVRDGNAEIYVMNADGTGQTNISNNRGPDFEPSWSPDGEKIAFVRGHSLSTSTSELSRREIYVMNADDGSDQTRLTDNSDHDGIPSWSPDGTKIAFVSTRAGGSSHIFVMNADDGSNVTRLPPPIEEFRLEAFPSWSPDGEKIAFAGNRDSRMDDDLEIYVMNADDGSNVTRLTDDDDGDYNPSWSPDGEKIAFARDIEQRGNPGIFVMNANDGSDMTRLTNIVIYDVEPDWGTNTSPAGGGGGNGDTTPPAITVPDDMVVEATSSDGVEVTYTVTAQDDIDGTATLEEDGSTVTQDDVGGDITISCAPPSGSVFPIGENTVECSATDEAGNTGTASFTVTVNPPSPLTPAQEAIDELISTIQNLDDNDVPQGVKTSLIAVLNEVLNILNDNNPNNDGSACGTLDAFINQVNANGTSDTLTADDADELSTQGEDIRNALDC